MQKTTTLKDFKVFLLKTILAILVLGISFKGIGQELRSKKFGATQAKPTQVDATLGVEKPTATFVGKANVPSSEAQAIARKQQMRAQGAGQSGENQTGVTQTGAGQTGVSQKGSGATGTKVNSNPAKARTQSDVPANSGMEVSSAKGSPSPNNPTVACLFNGTITATDPSMTQRLFRPGGAGGSCAAPMPFPGTINQVVRYDTYTFQNTTGGTACVVANLTSTDPAPSIQAGAWLGTFNPASLATNYIADPYLSAVAPGAPGVTFSFNLANNATVVFVVWSINPTNSGYTLSVDGLPNICTQPPCVPPTASVISAVAIPLTEGFDGTVPPAGWSIQNHSAPIGTTTWRQGNADGVFTSHTGAGFAAVNFTSGAGVATLNNWLIGPNLTLKNGDQFTFWSRAATGGGVFPDRLQVRMSTNGTSTNVGSTATDFGDFSNLLLDINPTYSTTGYPEVWTQFTATVSGVTGPSQSGRIAFRYFVENGGPGGANSNYIGVDDVKYITGGSPTVCAGGSGFVKVDITGGVGPFNLVLNANPGGNFPVNNYQSGQLIPVGPINGPTTYTIVSVTAAGTGANCLGTNNSGSAVFGITPASTSAVLSQVQIPGPPTNLINEDFITVVPPGWFAQNNSIPVGTFPNWFQGVPAVFPANSGPTNSYAAANFQATTGTNTISEWLLTPSIAMKNGDKFSFFTRTTTGAFPDRMQVRINTTNGGTNVGNTPTSVGDFTTLLLDINPTYTSTGYPTAWTQYSFTISGLPTAGVPAGRIAFRYFVENGGPNGANSDYIGVDNFVYTTFPLINPQTCTGSTANLKVDITGGTSPYTIVIGANPAQPGFPKTITNYISGTSIPVTPPFTTTYNLISVTSADGCLGTGNSGTPTITVSPTVIGPLTIIDQPTGPLCAGDPKLLTVTGAASNATFTNPGAIIIPNSGTASPSPATLVVSGLPTSGVTVSSVNINSFSHTWSGDVNIVLQHPNGTTNVILKGDSQADPNIPATNVSLVFSDAAAQSLPATGTLVSGTYKPTNRNGSPFAFLAPGPTVTGPTFPASPTLATFTGDMNGTWKLFVEDRVAGDQGQIAGGYAINFSVPSAPPVGYTFLWSPAQGLSSTTSNPVAASPMSTTTYTVMGTAPSGCQTTAQITITVLPLPAVTQNPTDVTACENGTATFTGAGSGAGLNYQWQVSTNGGTTWTNIPAGAPYTGQTTPTLTISPVALSMNNYRYRLGVNGTCPPTAYSTGAILTVNPAPVITLTPSGTICGGVAGIYGVQLSTGSSGPPVPGTCTTNSGTISVPIPDNSAAGAISNLAVSCVPANATITGVSVTVTMPHTWIGDMIFNLKAPNGTVLNLDKYLTGTGGTVATTGFSNTVISSAGVNALSTGTNPYTATFKADLINVPVVGPTIQNPTGYVSTATAWSQLYSVPNGTWTLAMADGGPADVGTLTSWSIKVDYTTPGGAGAPTTFTWAPTAGLYNDPTATIPYTGTQTPTVYAAPTVYTTYTVTATTTATGCTNTATVNVNPTPPPPTVTPNPVSMCLGDPAVRLISSSSTPGTCTVASGPISVPVPDNTATGASSNLTVACVPANASVTGISVSFNMPHTWDGDMIFNLKAPNGTVLNLDKYLTGTGGTAATTGFVNTVISSAGTTALSAGTNPYTGTFKADLINAPVAGVTVQNPAGFPSTATAWNQLYSTPNGVWTLAMADGGPGDVGTLTSWSITINYVVGNPTSAATWTPATFLWLDQAQTQPYVAGSQKDTVYTRPVPAGVYTYNVTVNSLPPAPVAIQTPMAGGNGNNMIFFVLSNTNAIPYTLTSLSSNAFGSGAITARLFGKVGGYTGNPGLINAANGWNVVGGPQSSTVTANTLNAVLTGLNIVLGPAGSPTADLGIGLEFTGATFPAYTNGTGTVQTFTTNGVSLKVDGNIGWGGPVAPGPPANNPRNFNGKVTLVASLPTCTSPPRVVTVTVYDSVRITTQPVTPAGICTNGSTSFTVAAVGSNLTYQWQVSVDGAGNTWANITNNANYSGATTNTLTITNPPASWNGYLYRVLINGSAPCGGKYSNNVRLTVYPLPTITLTAASTTNLLPGMTVALFASSNPAAATYQWLRNGIPVPPPAGTNNPLTVNIDGLGTYSVRVTDVNGCTNTSSNTIVVSDSTSGRVFIYPNPTSGQFGVRYNPAHNNVLARGVNIFDAMGKRITTLNYTLGLPFAPMNVDLSNMADGVYWVEVVDVDGNRLAMGRVVVGR